MIRTLVLQWLAPEKLRGCGAILLNKQGARFVDELTTRDKVTAAIMEQEGKVAWVVLGAEGAEMFGEGTLGFYGSKKMVTKVGYSSWVTSVCLSDCLSWQSSLTVKDALHAVTL